MKILNRIVTFVLALAVFPALVTRILIRIVEDPKGLMADSALIETNLNFSQLVDYIKDGTISIGNLFSSSSNLPGEILKMKGWLIATLVFIVIALLIAIVIMGCALFTRAHKTVMCLSAAGALSVFIAMGLFQKFTTPFTEGVMTLADLLPDSFLGGEFVGSIAEMLSITGTGDIVVFQLGNAFITMAIIFIGILLWTVAYYVTLPEEEKASIKNPPVKSKEEKNIKNNLILNLKKRANINKKKSNK